MVGFKIIPKSKIV